MQMRQYLVLIAAFTALISCKQENKQEITVSEESALYEQVAVESGIESWDEVKTVDFTFNVDRNGETVVSRHWKWLPQSDQVTFSGNDANITYNRNQQLDSLALSTDRSFINDVYWLLPQFKLVWDQGTQITSPDEGKVITIKYTGNDGYTPGDQYDMTIDDNGMIASWKYTPKGATQPAMETSFENYEDFNGIKIAKDHKTPDGSTNIYFTDVEITRE